MASEGTLKTSVERDTDMIQLPFYNGIALTNKYTVSVTWVLSYSKNKNNNHDKKYSNCCLPVYIHIVPAFLLQAMRAEVLLNTQMWQQFKLYDKAKLKIQLKCTSDVSAWPASSKTVFMYL